MIKLFYREVCSTCSEKGKVEANSRSAETLKIPGKWIIGCPNCTSGHVDKTMEFPDDGNLDVEGKGMITLRHSFWGITVMEYESGEGEDITESLNITKYEVIDEQNCPNPDCKNGITEKVTREYMHTPNHSLPKQFTCDDCNGFGKVSKVPSTTFFGSMKERDKEISKQSTIKVLEDILLFSDDLERKPEKENIQEYIYYHLQELNEGAIPYKNRALTKED